MPRSKKSIVWDHFVKLLDEGMVQCTICNRKMKFFGNTTNLKEHLRRTHPSHIAANEIQNDGYILFVDSPKIKKMKRDTSDFMDGNESVAVSDTSNIELVHHDNSFTIKENPYGDKDGYSVSISRQDQQEPIFNLGSDDFSKVVENTAFVDKSLLIEELFRYNYVLITAPRGFGKSTNWNMVKRFIEIEVNEEGNPKDIRQTENYRIFRDKKLMITERPKFCKEHMGQHPIISINFKPLSNIETYEDMLSKFRQILRTTFVQHRYLTKNLSLLLRSSNELFEKYCNPATNLTLSIPEIEMGFVFLSEMLFIHFRKQAVVMVDNYDAYVDSLMFKKNQDAERIVNFVQQVLKELLKSNQFVDRAFLTGVFPVTSSGIFTVTMNMKSFYFLDNHHFCKYYGLTSDELTEVLRRFVPELAEREKTERIIAEYYGGYLIPSQNLSVFNLWSVLNYLENKRVPLNYWCQSEHYDFFKQIFSVTEIAEEIQSLLMGLSRCADISKSVSNINFNSLSALVQQENGASCEGVFLKILYHLGYLTGNENLTLDQSEVFLKIPNSEIRLEFARILKDTFTKKYAFKERYIRALHSASNAFNVHSFDDSKFENFCRSLNDLFMHSSYNTSPKDSNDYQTVLFTFMASKFCITQSEIYKSMMSNSVDILTVNDSGVGIFIESRLVNPQKPQSDQDVAVSAHKQILDKKCCEYFDRNFEATMGKICIGICINEQHKISIAYSYHFQIGDDIDNPNFLSLNV